MCGIAGYVLWDSRVQPSTEELDVMLDSINHRGPDDGGTFSAPGCALGSRRLSIIDLSPSGHMPMTSSDGRWTIVYNGEIYNFLELRQGLEARGVRFRSRTDTEVLLNLFSLEGEACLSKLNGMFAFAIWDNFEKSLTLVRDRLGVKPLYYAETKDRIIFGSEEKQIFASGFEAQFDETCLAELLSFRYVAGEATPFVGVKRVLPGHLIRIRSGKKDIQSWWSLKDRALEIRRAHAPSEMDSPKWYEATFLNAVKLRAVSDVPIGILMSGGLDSSCVGVGLVKSGHQDLCSFTVSFADPGYDESHLAKLTAQKLGFQSLTREIRDEDLYDLCVSASWYSDEPLIHGNDPHMLAISQFAKSKVTVLLSGEGADETLGGYVRYRPFLYPNLLRYSHLLKLLKLPLGNRIQKLINLSDLRSIKESVIWNSSNLLQKELKASGFLGDGNFSYRYKVLEEAEALYPKNYFRQAMYLDQHTFLQSLLHRNDRMTMGASIECRVPYLDYRLVEGLAALTHLATGSASGTKPLLRGTVGRWLPTEVRQFKKWGFGVPWMDILRRNSDLGAYMDEVIKGDFFSSFLSKRSLDRISLNWRQEEARLEPLILQMFFIEVWRSTYFKKLREQRERTLLKA